MGIDGGLNGGLSLVAPILALAGLLALINERTMEVLVKRLLSPIERALPAVCDYRSDILLILSMITGAVFSLSFGIDFISPLITAVLGSSPTPLAGMLMSALVIGGGSNLLHELWSAFKSKEERPIS
jgi:hypothetical protein